MFSVRPDESERVCVQCETIYAIYPLWSESEFVSFSFGHGCTHISATCSEIMAGMACTQCVDIFVHTFV